MIPKSNMIYACIHAYKQTHINMCIRIHIYKVHISIRIFTKSTQVHVYTTDIPLVEYLANLTVLLSSLILRFCRNIDSSDGIWRKSDRTLLLLWNMRSLPVG